MDDIGVAMPKSIGWGPVVICDEAVANIPGGPIHDADGKPLEYDIKAQTHAVVQNITRILEEAGGSIDDVLDVTSFLVDMDRDFKGYNEVWAETLGKVGPTRTTLAIRALPTPIAVEMKVIANAPALE